MKRDMQSMKATASGVNDIIAEKNSSIGLLKFKVDKLDKDFAEEVKAKKKLEENLADTQLELSIVVKREIARWEAGVSQYVQTEPPTIQSTAVQTEFIQPQVKCAS